MQNSRFSYVEYDEQSALLQEKFKSLFEQVESLAEKSINDSRAKSLLLTYLEVAYMWTGKAIRDNQLEREAFPARAAELG